MKYSGSSIVTTRQVGSAAYVIEDEIIYNTTISRTRSTKSGSGSVVVSYQVAAFPGRWYPSAKVFSDESSLKSALEVV